MSEELTINVREMRLEELVEQGIVSKNFAGLAIQLGDFFEAYLGFSKSKKGDFGKLSEAYSSIREIIKGDKKYNPLREIIDSKYNEIAIKVASEVELEEPGIRKLRGKKVGRQYR